MSLRIGTRLEDKTPGKFLSRLGCYDTRGSWRFNFGTWNKPFHFEVNWKPKFAFQLYKSGDGPYHYGLNFAFLYPEFFIQLPFLKPTWKSKGNSFFPSWGFNVVDWKAIHFNWGDKCKIFDFPFVNTVFKSSETYLYNRKWYKWHENNKLSNKNWHKEYDYVEKNKYKELHEYVYVTKYNEIQKTTAICSLQRQTRHLKGLGWLGWPKFVTTRVDVTFKDEIGERRGSWKGGVTGCSTDIKQGETIKDALRRMQDTRRFN